MIVAFALRHAVVIAYSATVTGVGLALRLIR